jgi:hypothetical protein
LAYIKDPFQAAPRAPRKAFRDRQEFKSQNTPGGNELAARDMKKDVRDCYEMLGLGDADDSRSARARAGEARIPRRR